MANIKSKIKSSRKTILLNKRNTSIKSEIKTMIKKTLVKAGDPSVSKEDVSNYFSLAQKKIARAKRKGVLHKNTVSRKISRLALAVNRLNREQQKLSE